jgi:uncharacterized membrane protein
VGSKTEFDKLKPGNGSIKLFYLKQRPSSHFFFLVPLVLVALWLIAIIPPIQSPDEPSHLVRALSIQKGLLLDQSAEPPHYYGSNIDASLDRFIKLHEELIVQHNQGGNIKYTHDIHAQASRLLWGELEAFRPAPAMAYYFPAVYMPHYISLKLGELMGWTISNTYTLVRVMVALVSISLLWWAFQIHPPPFALLCLLSLPMVLFQFASPTIDGITLSLSILVLSIYASLTDKGTSKRLELVLASSILAVALTRLHLFPLIFLIFFLYVRNKSRFTLGLFIFCLLCYFSWYLGVMSLNDSVAPAGRAAASAVFEILTNPLIFLGVLFRTITDSAQIMFLLNSFIGNLGWLDAPLPSYGYKIFYCLIAVIVVVQIRWGRSPINKKNSWLHTSIFALCVLIAFMALYIVNTPLDAKSIMGMQGRYFIIPIAALLYQFAPYSSGPIRREKYLKVSVFCFLVFSTYFTVAAIEMRYY